MHAYSFKKITTWTEQAKSECAQGYLKLKCIEERKREKQRHPYLCANKSRHYERANL